MDGVEIVLTIALNSIPILILFIPYLFLRKKLMGYLYLRIYAGILVFYVIYWILPVIFQIGAGPEELESSGNDQGFLFLGAHLGSLISLFAYYPLATLPFIFFVAPFISILYVWNRMRKEDDSIKNNLKYLTYQLKESPIKRIRNELLKNDWTREKEILKLLIVLLPISLYLLQVILSVSGLENDPLTTGETALGWFLEILFVYLAIFILSIELLHSSQIALKGRYFGEDIRSQTYKSLYTVGAPISILSIILFIAQYSESLPIIVYFFAYFTMASAIFVLFFKIFEPISILIFIKLVDWVKNRKEKIKNMNISNISYGIIIGFIAFLIYLALNLAVFQPLFLSFFENADNTINSAQFLPPVNPTLSDAISFDLMVVFNFIILLLVPIILVSVLLAFILKYVKSTILGLISFFPIIIIFSIIFLYWGVPPLINFAPPAEYWITGQTSFINIFNYDFYTLRTAALDAKLSGVLGGLALPYLYTRYLFNLVIWTLLIFYAKKKFVSKNLPIDENHIEKVVFSTISDYLSYDDYAHEQTLYLISKKIKENNKEIEEEREEILSLLKILDDDKLLKELKPTDETEKKRFYFTLRYLFQNDLIDLWKPEFRYTFERVEKQGLYIIYDDGRGVYSYPFQKNTEQDPGLVSGMFSAITAFIKEMTKSTESLKKIDHGDITILLEYGNRIFGALFVKGTQTSEVRAPLKEFVSKFEKKYSKSLKNWNGALYKFKDDDQLVQEIFDED